MPSAGQCQGISGSKLDLLLEFSRSAQSAKSVGHSPAAAGRNVIASMSSIETTAISLDSICDTVGGFGPSVRDREDGESGRRCQMEFTPKIIAEDFDRLRRCADRVFALRSLLFERMQLKSRCHQRESALQAMPRLCVLASSSRGGTSVTAELLQWQGAECRSARGRLLTLPGEEKPHLILADLAFPCRREQFDDLNETDASVASLQNLRAEIASEIGYPISRCDDLGLYAMQLYRRLLLQWPLEMIDLNWESIVSRLLQALQARFPRGYEDGTDNRRQVLKACMESCPFIDPSYYDCWPLREKSDSRLLAGRSWSIEETPFILPPPWKNASMTDLEAGCLLLRDPSNAWRLPFWRAAFREQQIQILHLARDPRESVQGLCDGWNYQFGFQTMPYERASKIPGYNDQIDEAGNEWKRGRLNFSIDRSLSAELSNEDHHLTLVQICARQWRDAHDKIIADSERLHIPRAVVRFASLRDEPEKTFKEMCQAARLEPSPSGFAYARSFPHRWVMATSAADPKNHKRWKTSPFAEEIRLLASSAFFDKTIRNIPAPEFFADSRAVSTTREGSIIGRLGGLSLNSHYA